MNVLFFGYWGANEGISQATINPHLEILADMNKVHRIIYVSIERTGDDSFSIPRLKKIIHQPFYSKFNKRLLSKVYDFIEIPRFLRRLARENHIDLIMCRSSLAGSIGYLLHRKTRIPFTVESFEPHADYMLELGIWPKMGMSFQLQKFLEKKQKENAHYLMPVSHHYGKELIHEGLAPERIMVMPCSIDSKLFEFSLEDRSRIRVELGINSKTIVGIYVGKFGDIYWDFEAFKVFKSAFGYYEDFYLIILSSHNCEFIHSRCIHSEIPLDRVYHKLVPHSDVPKFLSASDFAFSTIRPSKNRKFCSPIKNGEYWANGLPIVSTMNIGDDSDIILKENGGLIISDTDPEWEKLEINRSRNLHIEKIASKYRSVEITKNAYLRVLNEEN